MIQDLKVTDLIPHRAPFLWVDSMIGYDQSSLITEKYIPEDLDVFKGHYPGHPILPGVLLCEAIFQTGALFIALLLKESQVPSMGVPVLTRVEGIKFKRPVGPGDTIRMKVALKETLGGAWFLKGTLRVKEKVSVQVDFACTLANLK
ncbi:MAG: beta-hydroxyacyl-ACP dehydratase [Desulfocapsa sp.]|uniref:Beta-hydroxyacyl-ACP dehydratase n=1 Tax=Desulfotalea psychrophila TaxID=84980 RepID=A0ABS3AS56_9BACT|nr:beta-hydroxyacyl-ACP dehydratase [Desulfocapsa sp.]MBN4067944.1 beta-hydroxyacyl-ACP dehydratase [Desulfotalea psychrophila]